MIYKTLKYFTGLALVFVCLNSCDKSTPTDTEKQVDKPVPTKATGNAAQNAVNYELKVLLGNEQAATTTVGGQEATVNLDRGKTYTWTVTSKNESGSTVSDTYSFTTPGLSEGNYAPYSAEILTEFETVEKLLTVSWIGSDEDGDDLTYDVIITENETVILEEIDFVNTSISGIGYTNNTNYTINIISKDGTGNFSISEVIVNSPE